MTTPCIGCDDPVPAHGVNPELRTARASTTAQRAAWAPACTDKGAAFTAAYSALNACLKVFGYEPRSGVTGAYNCRKITGGTGWSLHAYGPGGLYTFWTGVRVTMALAVDINWDRNPYGPRLITDMPMAMIEAIERIRTRNGAQVWRWGGRYTTNKDAMHFEIICDPHDLGTGIDTTTLPGQAAKPTGWQPPPFPGVIRFGSPVARSEAWGMLLRAAGYQGFNIGGSYGSGKYLATRRLQKRHGLTVDGIVGPATWAKACEIIAAKKATAKGKA